MAENTFGISIGGKGLSPDTLRLRDLYDVLRAFEVAINSTAAQGSGPIDADFHLIGIREGNSADCLIAVGPTTYRAAIRCAAAVASRDLSELPEKAREQLLLIKGKAKNKDWRIRIGDGNGMPTAEIAPNTEFVTDAVITGPTSLAGKVLRIGGTPRPTASLWLLDGRRLTASVANEELAMRLGKFLYRVVSLDGEAKWTSADWSLVDFKITAIGGYDADVSIANVLGELASIAGDFWDDVDPDEYIASLRAESD